MSTQIQSSRVDDQAVDNYEVVDLGYGRLDDAGAAVELGPIEIEPAADPELVRARRGAVAAPQRHVVLALAVTFVLGLTIGIVGSRADGHAVPVVPVALELGSASLEEATVPLSASAGIASVAIPVHNAGRDDFAVLALSLPGWQPDLLGSAQEPVTIPAGQTRTVTTGAQLNCDQPRPPTAGLAEARVRTNSLGVIIMSRSLAQPARELTTRWEQFCASAP